MSDPFRDGFQRSPALERLASRHPDAHEIRDVERLPEHALTVATGVAIGAPAPIGCLPALGWFSTVALGVAWLAGWVPLVSVAGGVAGIVVGHVGHALARARWQRTIARRLRWVDQQPFPITGVRGYLAAGLPMIDVTFRGKPQPSQVIDGIRGHTPGAAVSQLDDRTFRIALHGTAPRHHGDEAALHRFVDEVLVPVHHDLGVESVTLGGRAPLGAELPALPPGPTRSDPT